jgi:hypothetical protein
MRCDACESFIDTDISAEDIILWTPICICASCFEKMPASEVWELAFKALKHEFEFCSKETLDKDAIMVVIKRVFDGI